VKDKSYDMKRIDIVANRIFISIKNDNGFCNKYVSVHVDDPPVSQSWKMYKLYHAENNNQNCERDTEKNRWFACTPFSSLMRFNVIVEKKLSKEASCFYFPNTNLYKVEPDKSIPFLCGRLHDTLFFSLIASETTFL
jgi:hypothetical protein